MISVHADTQFHSMASVISPAVPTAIGWIYFNRRDVAEGRWSDKSLYKGAAPSPEYILFDWEELVVELEKILRPPGGT